MPAASAAQGLGRFAPLEIFAQGYHTPDQGMTTLTAGVVRAVPVNSLLPQVTRDSRFEALHVEAGGRFQDGEAELRGRFRAVHFEIQRSPWSVGFTLVDHNRSSILKQRSEWLGLAFGPSFNVSRPAWSLSARIMGHASGTSYAYGEDEFPELTDAEKIHTGLAYGGRSRITLFAGSRVMLDVSGKLESNTSGDDPLQVQAEAALQVLLSPRFSLRAFSGTTEVEYAGQSERATWFGAGLIFRQMATAF